MIDTRTSDELAEAGISVHVDENGKRHIRMIADPFIMLRDGPVVLECACGASETITESGSPGWARTPAGEWICRPCRYA